MCAADLVTVASQLKIEASLCARISIVNTFVSLLLTFPLFSQSIKVATFPVFNFTYPFASNNGS